MLDSGVIAEKFVDFALAKDWEKLWAGVEELSAEETRLLFEMVSAAGFNPKSIVLGKLRGEYRDQDGSRTGETYGVNNFCPYKVINEEDHDHFFATGWFSSILSRVVRKNFRWKEESREEKIEAVKSEIERSIPLKPIQLTRDGDMLLEYPPSMQSSFFVDHTRDDEELSSCVGIHKYCGGWIDRCGVTKTHDAFVCGTCYIRVLFPKEVKTYGELRQAMVFT